MNNEEIILPNSWEWSTLAELLDRLQYGYTAKASIDEDGPYFLRITDLQEDGVAWERVPKCIISEKDIQKYQLKNGDIVFARSGSIEKAWYVEATPPKAVFASYLIRGCPLDESIGLWLKHFIRSKNYLEQIGAAGSGIGMQNVNAKKLGAVRIEIPPLNEQKRIADKIQALQAKTNKAKQALETAKPLLDKLRQSILAAAFRGDLTADWRKNNPDVEPASILLERIRKERRKRWEQTELAKIKAKGKEPANDKWKARYKEPEPVDTTGLPELPDGWCWGAIKEFGIVKGGKRLPKGSSLLNQNTEFPYIRAGNLKEGTVKGKILFLSKKDQNKISKYTISSNDAYITIVGACIGDAGVVPMDLNGANLTENAAKISELSQVNNHYLGMALQSPILQFQIKEKTLSAAQGKLALSRIALLFVPICPLNEQKEIINKIKDSLKKIEILAKKIELISELGINLNQSILSQAFRGDLVPQDPTDEPASVLLERIKAKRKAMQPKKKATTKQKTQAV